ncbi:Uncharacterised protein [Raoultella terrigena]|uniref:Uncharacterized protein n=1 Tax=Raoultella terrigena TaxID=577 RepID=A0A4U9CSA7_RAOTE|nr:Uncharacterised protein [Raoultella terrigena]
MTGCFSPNRYCSENLLKQTEGLTNLIEDLRVVSSSGGAGYTLTLKKVDLSATMTSALDTFYRSFDESSLLF